MDRTDSKIDTPLTQDSSLVVRGDGAKNWVVIHKLVWGPFDSAEAAFTWAERKWPRGEFDVQGLSDPKA